ncbi:MAG: hypothetical protein R3304_07565 [Longimicrobiales bacterium]|nr:hypothetical protein [Longimicrobiales bacterium]
MKRDARWLVRGTLGLLSILGIVMAWSAERASVERANRLKRQGNAEAAAALYRTRTALSPTDALLRYNLGTTLATLDSASAELELSRASPGATREVRGRAEYNLGVLRLERALNAAEPDSVRAAAQGAVDANQAALRLRPGDPDAKWNLAMAVRLLDSITTVQRRSGRELTDGAVEADVVTRSVNVPDPAEDERAEDPPAEGERETVVTLGDESPLTPEEAAELLGTTHRDPRTMLEKLFELEGRHRAMTPRASPTRRW